MIHPEAPAEATAGRPAGHAPGAREAVPPGRLRRELAQRVSALRSRASGWVGRLTGSRRGLARPRLAKQAFAALRRGNLEAAFALLREEVTARPEDERIALAFWDVAVSCDRAGEAAEAMASVVRQQAATGRRDVATDSWMALVQAVPDAVVDAGSLARLLPELRTRTASASNAKAQDEARAWLLRALRAGLDPRSGPTVGLALHLFEEARSLDTETASRAARIALASPELHEAKRARLEAQLAALEGREPPAVERPEAPRSESPPAPERAARERPARPPATETPEAHRPPVEARASTHSPRKTEDSALRIRAIESAPVELTPQGLLLREVASGQRTRVDYRAVEAVAVAHVTGLAEGAVLIIDLVLKGSPQNGDVRHVLRLRGDRFDPRRLVPQAGEAGAALCAFLGELLERTRAVPLPDPDGALGLAPRLFDSLDDYEEQVLGRLRR